MRSVPVDSLAMPGAEEVELAVQPLHDLPALPFLSAGRFIVVGTRRVSSRKQGLSALGNYAKITCPILPVLCNELRREDIQSWPERRQHSQRKKPSGIARAAARGKYIAVCEGDDYYDPHSPYSASKAAADHFARAYHRTYGLPVLVTNCSNNYGPYQFPEKLVPLMILNAIEGKPLPVYGDGENVRDWLYVEDHCEALRHVLLKGRPGETYNIGGGCQQRNLDVVETICRLVDQLRPGLPHAPCRGLIRFVADRPGHDRRYAIDPAKIQRELGWRPRHDFESSLRATVAWYLEHPHWQVSHPLLTQRAQLPTPNSQLPTPNS